MWVYIIIAALIISSFLNICIIKISRCCSVIDTQSYYVNFKTKSKILHLLPVVNFLLLKSKYRHCSRRISSVYFVVQITTVVIFLVIYYKVGFSIELVFYIIFASILIIAAFIDVQYYLVPDILPLIIAVTAFIFNIIGVNIKVLDGIYASIIGGGFIIIVNYLSQILFKKQGMGIGDAKLMAAIGMFLGVKHTVLALVLSIYLAALVVIYLILVNGFKSGQRIPFVPFLSLGSILSKLYFNQIINWYINLFNY